MVTNPSLITELQTPTFKEKPKASKENREYSWSQKDQKYINENKKGFFSMHKISFWKAEGINILSADTQNPYTMSSAMCLHPKEKVKYVQAKK